MQDSYSHFPLLVSHFPIGRLLRSFVARNDNVTSKKCQTLIPNDTFKFRKIVDNIVVNVRGCPHPDDQTWMNSLKEGFYLRRYNFYGEESFESMLQIVILSDTWESNFTLTTFLRAGLC